MTGGYNDHPSRPPFASVEETPAPFSARHAQHLLELGDDLDEVGLLGHHLGRS